ncbi:recombinase family protein [Actinomadura sp. DC4]|uniref:recombinase family protein n=1 Tax=Actinomadura sp. DC4 TaxID=3055069 RepID=UPI0025B100AC|nr:recombinase family protein [Actinomadura sp. DC4]MDN3356024.1 recombinase family protein [Actinomadura sp. DC4]
MPPQTLSAARQLAALPDEPIPAIGYIRVSTAREEMISPELQKASITDWAARNNRRIVMWIIDLDKSGRNFRRRIQRAISAVEAGEAKEIIVWKFSRFGRQRLGWAVNLDRVESVGGDLVSATEEIDARTAAGRFARGMLAEVAAFESDRASEGWIDALRHRREEMKLPAQGTPRFGYVRKGRIPNPGRPNSFILDVHDPLGERYEPHERDGRLLAGLYVGYVGGHAGGALVKLLNWGGVKTVRGGTWTMQSLFGYLDSGFAAGLLRIHRRDCRCKQPGRCQNVEYLPGAHKPVITMETWEAYLARRRKQRRLPSRTVSPVYPLSGLMRCGHGGENGVPQHALSSANKHGQTGYGYICKWAYDGRGCVGVWVQRKQVEEAVRARLATWADDIDEQARVTEARAAVKVTARTDRERLGRDLQRIDKALGRLVKERALDPDMPDAIYASTRQELLDERKEIEAALETASEEEEANSADHLPVIRTLLDEWDTIAVGRKRDLLATLIRHVMVFRTGVRTPPRIVITPVWEPDVDAEKTRRIEWSFG